MLCTTLMHYIAGDILEVDSSFERAMHDMLFNSLWGMKAGEAELLLKAEKRTYQLHPFKCIERHFITVAEPLTRGCASYVEVPAALAMQAPWIGNLFLLPGT
eukprot:5843161-Amphidinium_carterae.1